MGLLAAFWVSHGTAIPLSFSLSLTVLSGCIALLSILTIVLCGIGIWHAHLRGHYAAQERNKCLYLAFFALMNLIIMIQPVLLVWTGQILFGFLQIAIPTGTIIGLCFLLPIGYFTQRFYKNRGDGIVAKGCQLLGALIVGLCVGSGIGMLCALLFAPLPGIVFFIALKGFLLGSNTCKAILFGIVVLFFFIAIAAPILYNIIRPKSTSGDEPPLVQHLDEFTSNGKLRATHIPSIPVVGKYLAIIEGTDYVPLDDAKEAVVKVIAALSPNSS